MGQPQSMPQNKRSSMSLRVSYDGSKDGGEAEESHASKALTIDGNTNTDCEPSLALPNKASLRLGDVEDESHPLIATLSQNTVGSAATVTLPLIDAFQDHYSLGSTSTTLRFRSRYLRILDDDRNHQLVLEEQRVRKDASATATATAASSVATVKLTATTNFGMALSRTIFTLPALFIMTCTFAFCVQCVLFLFMNIVGVETQQTWEQNPPAFDIVAATFAVPLLLYSLASAMTISWALVVDCWRGLSSEQTLLRNMVFWDPVLTEWISLAVFAGFPLITLLVTTFMGTDDWYELTIGTWAIAVLFFQTFYMLLVFLNELHMCAQLSNKYMPPAPPPPVDGPNTTPTWPLWVQRIQYNIVLAQRQKYSGVRHERYLVRGTALPPPEGFSNDSRFFPVQWQLKLGTRWTLDGYLWGLFGKCNRTFFTVLDPPLRNYTIEEVFGNVMILSKNNWSLERVWCMDRTRSSAITVTQGTGSVSQRQMTSGHVCIGLFGLVIILVLAGFLAWMGQGVIVILGLIALVFFLCLFPILLSSYQVRRFYSSNAEQINQGQNGNVANAVEKKEQAEQQETTTDGAITKEDGDRDEEDPQISTWTDNDDDQPSKRVSFHAAVNKKMSDMDEPADKVFISVWESLRVSEMRPWFCWLTAFLEVSLFFVYPLISLFAMGNTPIALVFLIAGITSVIRHFFNVTNLLQEVGPIDDIDWTSSDLSPALCGLGGGSKKWLSSSFQFENERKLKNKSLVATIVTRCTRSKATGNWIVVFFVLFFIVFVAFIMASTEEEFQYKVKGVVFPNEFYYDAQPQLPYPTCSVQKGFSFPGQEASSLADYSFLSVLSFSGHEESQPLLDQWFGQGQVVDDYQFVASYREATGTLSHPVSYKLYTITSLPDSAVVGIRGSESMWDWAVDVQLWAGGVLAQTVKAVNPFGWLWTPILDEMVYVINSVQSRELKDVSYYRYTSQFVNDMYAGFDGRQYQNLRVTGASLGGGLSILTGAITGASAIAISGLNAMYSRRTFDPPITEDQLNTRVFNVIPDRDPIASIDKPGRLYQSTECRAPLNAIMGCHSMWRSLCEIQYQCGSNGRPINCWCTSKYGYPPPKSNSTVTWEEACASAPT